MISIGAGVNIFCICRYVFRAKNKCFTLFIYFLSLDMNLQLAVLMATEFVIFISKPLKLSRDFSASRWGLLAEHPLRCFRRLDYLLSKKVVTIQKVLEEGSYHPQNKHLKNEQHRLRDAHERVPQSRI